jgi:hypothetical protein
MVRPMRAQSAPPWAQVSWKKPRLLQGAVGKAQLLGRGPYANTE